MAQQRDHGRDVDGAGTAAVVEHGRAGPRGLQGGAAVVIAPATVGAPGQQLGHDGRMPGDRRQVQRRGAAGTDEIPLDYYSRLVAGAPLPLYVIEGGWPSTSALGSSPDEQRRYIERQARLLDTAGALAWFQITFTDLDVATLGAGLAPFADLGLVDKSLQPKAALATWDAVFARPRPR